MENKDRTVARGIKASLNGASNNIKFADLELEAATQNPGRSEIHAYNANLFLAQARAHLDYAKMLEGSGKTMMSEIPEEWGKELEARAKERMFNHPKYRGLYIGEKVQYG